MLHIYYGLGKGKSSALNGSAIRAKGANMRVGFFKFLKGCESSEDKFLNELADDFKRFHNSNKFVIQMDDNEKIAARQEAKNGLNYILMNSKNFDMIIIDEIIDLRDPTVNFFTANMLKDFLKNLSTKEVLISGHSLPPEIKKIADLVTYFEPEKHYMDKGILARKGIEF